MHVHLHVYIQLQSTWGLDPIYIVCMSNQCNHDMVITLRACARGKVIGHVIVVVVVVVVSTKIAISRGVDV